MIRKGSPIIVQIVLAVSICFLWHHGSLAYITRESIGRRSAASQHFQPLQKELGQSISQSNLFAFSWKRNNYGRSTRGASSASRLFLVGGDTSGRTHRARTMSSAASLSSISQSYTDLNATLPPPPPPTASTHSPVGLSSTTVSSPQPSGQKLRLLKDLMWVREAQEDLTAAEFACSVEAHDSSSSTTATTTSAAVETPRKRKRAVDYEKLLDRLNRRIRDMGCEAQGDGSVSCILQPNVGMGSVVYNDDQRQALLQRILVTRQVLLEFMKGNELYHDEELSFSISLPEIRVEIPKEDDSAGVGGVKLYVRDDGTVDWDGALQDREALRKFGTAVWARINGRDPELLEKENSDNENGLFGSNDHGSKPKEVTARIEETPRIREERQKLDMLKKELQAMEKAHIALLNSAISAGQAVANVNLASLAPAQRAKIRKSAEALEKLQERVSFQTLIYELERLFTYLMGELGNPSSTGYIPLQDRLNVAEFGLLESQIDMLSRMLNDSENLDSDVLAVVMEQLIDMKRRLGIDYLVTGLSFDGEAIRRWSVELLEKTKKGLTFYVKGVRLFWNDIVFCMTLINRAAQGYTLKPREVRTLRRTFKDIITFIPVVIILLIPLSPVGHVLVFGAIQRFFPDFFPSCFTEQRQNLLQLYETAEYSEFTIKENFKEKLARLSEAIIYFMANASRALYLKIVELIRNPSSKGKSDDGDDQPAKQ